MSQTSFLFDSFPRRAVEKKSIGSHRSLGTDSVSVNATFHYSLLSPAQAHKLPHSKLGARERVGRKSDVRYWSNGSGSGVLSPDGGRIGSVKAGCLPVRVLRKATILVFSWGVNFLPTCNLPMISTASPRVFA
uniref:Uncharacterized protein n=1 Tax=Candidatus Kentrum sp. MB TaxID=2138164 RepID=A0A450XW11_9GAMM|nr:MAG: hypothetical protein BECKMB1821G_GA0114241_10482 [Candidatus Kentron sp. MB]VFK33494.1 MAG: hypothetical protein BECKMB1821I_GA0114274_10472 [Candidatus Kentron sp. MB]VFK76237.1 MAG: hypothetical protein BECKMB1821H_GA0114242_10482 [Candidatus Kentron sp. MB]